MDIYQELAGKLSQSEEILAQNFYEKNLFFKDAGTTPLALLKERLHFLKKDSSRNNVFLLVLIGDMCWQTVLTFTGIKKNPVKWAEKKGWDNTLLEALENINWIYDLHTCLRHPAKLVQEKFPWIYDNPWPKKHRSRLIQSAEGQRTVCNLILNRYSYRLDLKVMKVFRKRPVRL